MEHYGKGRGRGLFALVWPRDGRLWKREGGLLTLRPRIWLMAADSLSVHSSITVCRISFMKTMKALRGFLMCWADLLDRAEPLEAGSPDGERVDAVDGTPRRCPCPDCCLQRVFFNIFLNFPICTPTTSSNTSGIQPFKPFRRLKSCLWFCQTAEKNIKKPNQNLVS